MIIDISPAVKTNRTKTLNMYYIITLYFICLFCLKKGPDVLEIQNLSKGRYLSPRHYVQNSLFPF